MKAGSEDGGDGFSVPPLDHTLLGTRVICDLDEHHAQLLARSCKTGMRNRSQLTARLCIVLLW